MHTAHSCACRPSSFRCAARSALAAADPASRLHGFVRAGGAGRRSDRPEAGRGGPQIRTSMQASGRHARGCTHAPGHRRLYAAQVQALQLLPCIQSQLDCSGVQSKEWAMGRGKRGPAPSLQLSQPPPAAMPRLACERIADDIGSVGQGFDAGAWRGAQFYLKPLAAALAHHLQRQEAAGAAASPTEPPP